MNFELAKHALEELIAAGVKEWVVCPGARNAPLVQVLLQSNEKLSFWPEERSAAFYALGRAKKLHQPVAVLTTSGTAAGELLPALMEAYYSAVPLVAVTADRPRRYRKSGAPQTAEQVGLYGIYAETRYDLEGDELCSLGDWNRKRPIHMNICFEEPEKKSPEVKLHPKQPYALPKDPVPSIEALEKFFKRSKTPLIVVGGIEKRERGDVFKFLMETQAPVYIEAPSGLREIEQLAPLRVYAPDLRDYDGVLRIGQVPTHKLWRELESKKDLMEILSISSEPFSGLCAAPLIHGEIGKILDAYEGPTKKIVISQALMAKQQAYFDALAELLKEEPLSEASLVHALSIKIPKASHVFLGNSLPIREWDLASTYESRNYEVTAVRGLNGIDGQISCFLGLSDPKIFNAALIGDLTTLYDLAGFWGAKQLPQLNFSVFVLNNHGGKIFAGMFPEEKIQNNHTLSFEEIAKFWGLKYEKWSSIPQTISTHGQSLVELLPDPVQTERFKHKLKALQQELQAVR